ncbi:MAG: helix-turn-helix transcriptional regulator [Candidatus Promineofilum sp.]|nr:helix-turn-helix transcriptional regulator [Promineifilum sp.]
MSPLLRAPISTAHALLGLVRHEPLHGYQIYRRLTDTPELQAVWRMKQSHLYALLSRMEEEALLEAKLETQGTRPPRKVYHLTTAGAQAFDQWLIEPVAIPRDMRLEFMLKLYFALREEKATAARLIKRQQAVCAEWLATQEKDRRNATTPYLLAVRRFRRDHIGAIQQWLEWLPSLISDPLEPA